MAYIQLRNDSDYEFEDISTEKEREYAFDGVHVTIQDPQWIATSSNGHRILDGDGKSHYIGFDGFYMSWTVEEGAPHFVK